MAFIKHISVKNRCFCVMAVLLVLIASFIKTAVDGAWDAYQTSQYGPFQFSSACAGKKSFLYYQNSGIGILNVSASGKGIGQAFEVAGNGQYGIIWGDSSISTYNSGENRHFRSTIYISAVDHLTEGTQLILCDSCKEILLAHSQYSIIIADFTNKRFYPISSDDYAIIVNDYIVEIIWGRENHAYLDASYQFKKPAGIIEYIKAFTNLLIPVY